MITKQNRTKSGRRKEQRSSNSTEDLGNHSEETQHGPSQMHLISGPGKKMERNGINDFMKPRGAEGNVVVFHVHKEMTIGENYKEAYEL